MESRWKSAAIVFAWVIFFIAGFNVGVLVSAYKKPIVPSITAVPMVPSKQSGSANYAPMGLSMETSMSVDQYCDVKSALTKPAPKKRKARLSDYERGHIDGEQAYLDALSKALKAHGADISTGELRIFAVTSYDPNPVTLTPIPIAPEHLYEPTLHVCASDADTQCWRFTFLVPPNLTWAPQ